MEGGSMKIEITAAELNAAILPKLKPTEKIEEGRTIISALKASKWSECVRHLEELAATAPEAAIRAAVALGVSIGVRTVESRK